MTKWQVTFNVSWSFTGESWAGMLMVHVLAENRVEALKKAEDAIDEQTKFEIGNVMIGVAAP